MMSPTYQEPVLPSAEDQEARAIGNVLLRMEVNEAEARQWAARLRPELFHCLAGTFEALSAINTEGSAFTMQTFTAKLAEVVGITSGEACGRVSYYTKGGGGLPGDFDDARERLEQVHDRRELMRDGLARVARSQSSHTTHSRPPSWAWPDLEPGPFPLDALPSIAGRAASTIGETYRLPLELAGMVALATLGGSIGKAWRLSGAVPGRSNFGNVFVLCGADRGVGKGSCSALVDPLLRVSADREEHWRANVLPGLRTDAGIAKRSAESAEKEAATATGQLRADARARAASFQAEHEAALRKIEGVPTLWASDCTSQKLAVLLGGNADESLLIYSAEAGGVIRNWLGRYDSAGKADVDLQLSGYSCEPAKVDRIGRPSVALKAPCLSALLMVQPILVRELFGSDEVRERGLLARTMSFVTNGTLGEDDGIAREPDRQAMDDWGGLVACLLKLRHDRMEPLEVRADAEAEKVFRQFHNESIRLRQGPLASVSGDLSRWRENAVRVALIIHVSENPEGVTLSAATAERAVRLVRWAGRSTIKLLADGMEAAAKARAEKLRGWLHRCDGSLTLGALDKRFGMTSPEAVSLANAFGSVFVIGDHASAKGGPRTRMISLVE